jgi:hypothetical protein
MKLFTRITKKMDLATWAAILFFISLLILGFMIYSNYGISCDERAQIDTGIMNFTYVVHGNPALLTIRDRWYGPFFEVFLAAVQDGSTIQQLYLTRHLWNFITFFVGCIFFYLLARRLTRHNGLALIGTLCLVLSPRIFADAFYNSKDIPFLVLYTMSLLSMFWFLDKQTLWRGLFHAILTAATLAIRLPGLVIPALTILGLLIEIITRRTPWKPVVPFFFLYLGTTIGFGILFWPALWPDPWHGFFTAFQFMSHFPFDVSMLFMGQTISSIHLPWFYIPVWIAVTTPILYLLTFIPGLMTIVWHQRSWLRKEISPDQRDEVLVLLAFLLPLLTVILIQSVLYDAWRQMFFIYPPLLLISIKGLHWIWLQLKTRLSQPLSFGLGIAALLIGLLSTGLWMINNHPYQNVYFNRLAGKDMQTVQQNYMMDYWGLAYREGIEAILAVDDADHIDMLVETGAGKSAQQILPLEESNRIHAVATVAEADYFIGNYYMLSKPYPFKDELYAVKIGNAKILSVYRLSEEEKNLPFVPR